MIKISDFKTRLAEMLSERNVTAAWLGVQSGISKGTLSQYLKGVYKPKHEQLCRIAEALEVTPQWLEGYDTVKYPDDAPELVCRIGVYDINALNAPLRYEVCALMYKECFYVEADDHLYPAVDRYDLIMLENTDSLEDGQAALVSFREYRGLYIYRLCPNGVQLFCLNAYYPPVMICSDELAELKILGRVVMSIKMW